MKVEIKTQLSNIKIDNNSSNLEIIRGKDKFFVGRLYYYLTKTIYLLPRLYGIMAKDPLLDWKNELERQFAQILLNELSLAKLIVNNNNLDFKICTSRLCIIGNVGNGRVDAKAELKATPQIISEDKVRSLVKIDSFYFSDINKKKPYIIPAIRAGLIASFYKFLPVQFDGSPSIPKTLGIISDFINSMTLPQGYIEEVLGHKIHIKSNDLYCDDEIIYNAPPNVLSLFPIIFFVKNSSENNILVVEEPEAHLRNVDLTELFRKPKAKIVLISDMI